MISAAASQRRPVLLIGRLVLSNSMLGKAMSEHLPRRISGCFWLSQSRITYPQVRVFPAGRANRSSMPEAGGRKKVQTRKYVLVNIVMALMTTPIILAASIRNHSRSIAVHLFALSLPAQRGCHGPSFWWITTARRGALLDAPGACRGMLGDVVMILFDLRLEDAIPRTG